MTSPSEELIAALRASLARIESKAADLMVAYPDVPVDVCISAAVAYEVAMYGGWPDVAVGGLVGESPLQSLMRKIQP